MWPCAWRAGRGIAILAVWVNAEAAHTGREEQVTYLRSLSLQGCACPPKALCRKPVTVTNKGLIFHVSFQLTISTSIEIWLF